MEIAQGRPPFVEFKQVAIEDREQSMAAGRRVTKNINMAFIMQPGSRDQVEKVAEEWIEQIKRQSYAGNYPETWAQAFEARFNAWLTGKETPESGLPVREWPVLSPAEAENLISAKVFTVEDLANLNEEAIANLGMGMRLLRDKARAWFDAGNDSGKNAERLVALEVQVADLLEQNKQLQEALNAQPKKSKAA